MRLEPLSVGLIRPDRYHIVDLTERIYEGYDLSTLRLLVLNLAASNGEAPTRDLV